MPKYDELVLKLMIKNNGYLHVNQLDALGYDRLRVYPSIKSLDLVRVARGVYCSRSMRPDKMFLVCCRNENVVLSHESAAFFHHLLLGEPEYVSVTVQHGYNTKHLTEKWVIPYQVKRDKFDLGKVHGIDCYGNAVCVYDAERTVCDFIREEKYLKHAGNGSANAVISNYFLCYQKKNLELLRTYAKTFRIEAKAERYIRSYGKED